MRPNSTPRTIQFIFALHDHQPVGNFDHVFRDAFQKAYLPFLELIEAYPQFRVALHHTGPLLQWIADNERGYLERLGVLVARNQVELLGGAFYEPILPIIPEADRVGQIVAMSDWIESVFGVRPRGMWLAERVWEPSLPRAMRAAGIEFTVLDDSHFKSVGRAENECLGYYLTEEQGDTVAVFPINETLRHRIPYAAPEDVIGHLRTLADDKVARTATMADDGEKFGVWPDSHWHCYQNGWMARFVEMVVNNREWVHMRHFSEVLDETAPLGRVYLPTASYVEMMEWAMPPRSIAEYRALLDRMKERGETSAARTFVRAGFWRSFFSKYEESNHLHKKMLHVSRKLAALPEELHATAPYATALDHLWQGQCNCGYWHGVFGGLYLTNLRNALYGHLIAADAAADALGHGDDKDWVSFSAVDFACEGERDLMVETPAQVLHLRPHAGGMMVEHDLRAWNFNVLDTLMRRRESYHERLLESAGKDAGDQRVKEGNLTDHLAVDWYRRGALIDHFVDESATPEDFRAAVYPELGDFVTGAYEAQWKTTKGGGSVTLHRTGQVETPEGPVAVRVEKTITFRSAAAGMAVAYKVENLGERRLVTRFGVEFNVNLLAGDAPDRVHEVDGVKDLGNDRMVSIGALDGVSRFRVRDGWRPLVIEWSLSQPATHWRLPIETVSSSEAGIERVYQSTVVMPLWALDLAPGQSFEATINMGVREK